MGGGRTIARKRRSEGLEPVEIARAHILAERGSHGGRAGGNDGRTFRIEIDILLRIYGTHEEQVRAAGEKRAHAGKGALQRPSRDIDGCCIVRGGFNGDVLTRAAFRRTTFPRYLYIPSLRRGLAERFGRFRACHERVVFLLCRQGLFLGTLWLFGVGARVPRYLKIGPAHRLVGVPRKTERAARGGGG